MNQDRRGHTITTEVAAAAEALSNTIESFSQRQANTGEHLQNALQADPHCALIHAVHGLMLHGARTVAFQEQAQSALASAKASQAHITDRERRYVDALEYSLAGQLKAAVRCFEAVLSEHPTDLLALVFLQSELFWLGDMVWSERASRSVMAHWNAEVPGYPAFLAVRAFDLEENNAFDEAERVAKTALTHNPGDVWGAHAFAHVMLMQNRIDEGIQWMGERESLWDTATQMQFHLAWHHCLFLGERQAHDEMLSIYDKRVRNRSHPLCEAMPDLYIDLQNASSLLWRLEHAKVDVGMRWQELAEVCEPRIADMTNPFTSAHYALVLAADERFTACQELIDAMEAFAADSDSDLVPAYRMAAIPAAKAALAHRMNEHDKVIETLRPHQSELWRMGGSHAQQDVFYQVLADSTAKVGDKNDHTDLMDLIERIGFVEPTARIGYTLGA